MPERVFGHDTTLKRLDEIKSSYTIPLIGFYRSITEGSAYRGEESAHPHVVRISARIQEPDIEAELLEATVQRRRVVGVMLYKEGPFASVYEVGLKPFDPEGDWITLKTTNSGIMVDRRTQNYPVDEKVEQWFHDRVLGYDFGRPVV